MSHNSPGKLSKEYVIGYTCLRCIEMKSHKFPFSSLSTKKQGEHPKQKDVEEVINQKTASGTKKHAIYSREIILIQ